MKGYGKCIDEPLTVNGKEFRIICLSTGNPHCVIFVDDVEGFPVKDLGPKIENNGFFSERVNVEVTEVTSRTEMKMRLWQHGVDETLACGTGICAVVVAENILEKFENEVTVQVTPSIGFGECGEKFIRFSITRPKEEIEEACNRISELDQIESI